ncbi:hypothetical protein KKF03_04405 [Patescibacteria group bacterium]|nr:hypothetical protein [Patescibacteria group bacterium]
MSKTFSLTLSAFFVITLSACTSGGKKYDEIPPDLPFPTGEFDQFFEDDVDTDMPVLYEDFPSEDELFLDDEFESDIFDELLEEDFFDEIEDEEVCGNGILEMDEECEDESECLDSEICNGDCECEENNICGDGVISIEEDCENDSDCLDGEGCNSDCECDEVSNCGDDNISFDEDCEENDDCLPGEFCTDLCQCDEE